MALLAVTTDCIAGGFTKITLSFESQQTGSNTDNFAFRIVRRIAGSSDVVIPGEPQFIMTANRDIRSFAWIDPSIPAAGNYTYVVQVKRINGGGNFYFMNLIAEHFKK